MSSGSLDLGNLYGRLMIDYSGLSDAERAAAAFAKNTQSKLDSLAGGFKTAGKTLSVAVTAPVIAAAATSFEAARQFSISFADVQKNISDLDDSNIKEFENTILAIGRNSLLGADGVAALASEGGKLGENAKGALEFAKAAEQMAIAFDFGKTKQAAEEAGDIIGSIRSSFGYTTDEVLNLGDAINYFADTTASSAKGITKILQSQGATVKAVTNLTDGELTALAATFEAISPSVEIAATGMKNFTLALSSGTSATDKQSEVFNQLGLDAVEMAKLMKTDATKGILTVLKALGGLEEYEKSAAISTLFGKESIGTIAPLIENTKLIEENFTRAKDSSKFLGSIRKEYDRAMNTDDNKMALAMNALNVAMIQIGKVIVPIVADMAVSFSNFLTTVGHLDPGLVKLGVAFGAVAAAVGPLLLALGSALGFIVPLITSAGGLSAALSSLAAIGGPVTLAIAAIAGAGYLLYKNWNEVKAFVLELVNSIIGYFNKWKTDNSALLEELSANWSAFVESGKQLWTTLTEIIGNFVNSSIAWLDSMLEPIGGLQGAWELFKEGVGIALTAITQFLSDFLAGAKIVFDELNNALKSGDWSFFKELALMVLEQVTKAVVSFQLEVWNQLKKLPEYFKDIFNAIVEYIKSIDFLQLGKDLMGGLRDGIVSYVDTVTGAVKGAMGAVVKGAKDAVDSNSPSLVFMQIGKDLMGGLGIGIKDNTTLAVSEMIKAADVINSTARQRLTQDQFSGLESNVMLDSNMGIGGFNYGLEIEKEKAYYEQSLAMLEEAQALKLDSITSYAELREAIETKHNNAMIDLQRDALANTSQSLDATLNSLKSFGQEQSGIYKAIFLVSKAFAVAEAALALGQNIANASKVGFPYNIPFIAGAMAQGATIASNIASVSGAFNNGGYIPTGQVGMVGEKGPEFVTGPANVFSTQNTKEALNGKGGGGIVNKIVIQNLPGQTATVSRDRDATIIRIAVDTAKNELRHEAVTGGGTTVNAILKAGGNRRKA